ncbi:fibronectin-like [Engraulis encrasicolus]|uniref:fibronectin-like n=1 Tax=Engraulis encrasicolus TaxID=184585 RepID=UPI002FD6808C
MDSMEGNVPPPGSIQFVSVQPDSVSLRWSPPEGAPGHHTFKVTWTGGQKDSYFPVTSTNLEVTELTPGEKYHFTVATLSQDGRHSTPVEGAVYTEVPPPQNLQVEVTSPTATVTWTKPAGVDQVTYLLQIIRDQEVIRTIQRNSCQYTITGLQVDANYNVNVTTVLSNGRQSQPAVQTFRAEVPPPQNLQVEVTSPTASVTWTKPDGVDQVTYLLDIVKGQEEIRTVQRNSCQYTITGLQAGAEHTVNVATILSNGGQSKPASKTFNIGT